MFGKQIPPFLLQSMRKNDSKFLGFDSYSTLSDHYYRHLNPYLEFH